MSKYNVGDKFVLEIKSEYPNPYTHEECMVFGIKGFETLAFKEESLDKLERIKEVHDLEELEKMKQESFDAGTEAAWNLAKKITLPYSEGGMSGTETKEALGTICFDGIFNKPYQEIKEKIEAWERAKEEQKIHENDVVEILETAAVVLTIDNGIATVYVLDDEHAKVQEVPLHQLKKTGNSIDVLHVLSRACVKEFAKGSAD